MRRLNIALAAGVLAVGALSGAEAGSALWQGVRGAYSGSAVFAAEREHAGASSAAALDAPASLEPLVPLEPHEQAQVAHAVSHAIAVAWSVGF